MGDLIDLLLEAKFQAFIIILKHIPLTWSIFIYYHSQKRFSGWTKNVFLSVTGTMKFNEFSGRNGDDFITSNTCPDLFVILFFSTQSYIYIFILGEKNQRYCVRLPDLKYLNTTGNFCSLLVNTLGGKVMTGSWTHKSRGPAFIEQLYIIGTADLCFKFSRQFLDLYTQHCQKLPMGVCHISWAACQLDH